MDLYHTVNGIVHEPFDLSILRPDAFILVIDNSDRGDLVINLINYFGLSLSFESLVVGNGYSVQEITNCPKIETWDTKIVNEFAEEDENHFILISENQTTTTKFKDWTKSMEFHLFLASDALKIITVKSIIHLPRDLLRYFDYVFVCGEFGDINCAEIHKYFFSNYPNQITFVEDIQQILLDQKCFVKDNIMNKMYVSDTEFTEKREKEEKNAFVVYI